MLSLIVNSKPNIFFSQKATVGFDHVLNAYKYALIPIYEDLHSLCKIIPSQHIENYYCLLDYSVVQFTNIENALKASQKLLSNTKIKRQDIHIVSNIVETKIVNVKVVFHDNSKLEKWRSKNELANSLRNVLLPFVFVDSCLISLPSDGINNYNFRCIWIVSTGSKKLVSRVTTTTVINIEEAMSYDRFENMCLIQNPSRIFGLEKQYEFLETIYKAHVASKMLKISSDSKLIQKVLLIGPPGCGKTSMVKNFVFKNKCGFFITGGYHLHNSKGIDSDMSLRCVIEETIRRSRERNDDVCILMIDQIDELCIKSTSGSAYSKRSKYIMNDLLFTIKEHPGIIIIASTNNVHALDPSFRNSSRFEVEMFFGVPNEINRFEMLNYFCEGHVTPAVCRKVATCTPGFVGSDLWILARGVRRIVFKNKRTMDDADVLSLFTKYLKKQRCLALRGRLGVSHVSKVQMDSLGGLTETKALLKLSVEWPLKHPKCFRRLGVPVPKGILLYGPPGCAKTSLASSIAHATNVNFLTVSAAELYSAYLGEAERNVIDLFQTARVNSPCIVFIDEIDALVGNRSASSRNVQSKVLSTFLTEMDGVGNRVDVSSVRKTFRVEENISQKQEDEANIVIVIAATNRPDKLDSALLRPGRFDKLLFVGAPSSQNREDILRTVIKNRNISIADCVNLKEIAKLTENFTGADLTNLLNEAGYAALFADMDVDKIEQNHFLKALEIVKPSLTPGKITFFNELQKKN